MRTQIALAAIALMAGTMLSPATGFSQGAPSAQDIVKSLTPTGASGATRGIRIGPSGSPSQTSQSATSSPKVSLHVEFATDSADLTPQATHTLDRLGEALNDQTLSQYHFRIEGHTDTVGTRDANQVLSERRANAVVDYLSRKFHVDRSHLEAVGMGETGLAVPTPDQTPEARNRRVEVINIGS